MPKILTFPRLIRIGKYTEIARIYRTPVCVHWSVLVVAAFILAGAIKYPVLNLVGLVSWLGVILLHECGHLFAARRKGCDVNEILLYPIFGLTRFSRPWSELDHCVIAWAGVLAQAIVALPILVAVSVFGYTRFQTANAALAIWGAFSLGVAIFNLLPVPPLDGWTAWRIVPLGIGRLVRARNKRYRVVKGGR